MLGSGVGCGDPRELSDLSDCSQMLQEMHHVSVPESSKCILHRYKWSRALDNGL